MIDISMGEHSAEGIARQEVFAVRPDGLFCPLAGYVNPPSARTRRSSYRLKYLRPHRCSAQRIGASQGIERLGVDSEGPSSKEV
jgi:hypothetical protein